MLGIRTAITQSDLLLAGEQAATLTIPTPDDELLAAELAGLDRKPDAADAERRRLIDLYPGGFIQMPKMQRSPPRSPHAEKSCSTIEPDSLTNVPASPATISSDPA